MGIVLMVSFTVELDSPSTSAVGVEVDVAVGIGDTESVVSSDSSKVGVDRGRILLWLLRFGCAAAILDAEKVAMIPQVRHRQKRV